MTTGSAATDSEALFADVLAAAAILRDLPDVARAEAWGSSALSVWREDPAAAEFDREFVAWLRDRDDRDAALLLLATAAALDLEPDLVEQATAAAPIDIAWTRAVGSAQATRAWIVTDHDSASVGIGFDHADGSQLSLLGEVVGDHLRGLVAAPGPDELFDEAEDLVDAQPMAVGDAAGRLVAAWRRTVADGLPLTESMLVNQLLGRDRLRRVLGDPLDDLLLVPEPKELGDDVSAAERAELDAWALAILRGALGAPPPEPAGFADELLDPLLVDRRSRYPAEEAEAFAALEWADWLGGVLGVVRAGAGSSATPSALVDHVNRCPEITSTIPKAERAYFEWAWQHVLLLWERHGLVTADRTLTEAGASLLPDVLAAAWGGRDQ